MTEQSKLVIDEFVYDGNPKTSKISMKFAQGTARFVTGQMGKVDKQNINLRTPSAAIAVRGTDFTSTVDEYGRSLFLLLPEEDGSVGEISVSNDAGTVILNQAYQATMVASMEKMPTEPKVILGLDVNAIDNMLIVSPPKEITKAVEKSENKQSASSIDDDPLAKDYLASNALQSDMNVNLTINDDPLSQDFFSLNPSKNSRGGVIIKGTTFGKDKTTNMDTTIMDPFLTLIREMDSQTFQFVSNKMTTATINLTQNNKTFTVIINNGAGGTVININQGN